MNKVWVILFGLMVLVSPVYAYTFVGIGNSQGGQIEIDFHPETDSVTCSFMGDIFILRRPHSDQQPMNLWMSISGDISMVMAYDKKTGIAKFNMANIQTRETREMQFKYTPSAKYTVGNYGSGFPQ